MQNLSQSKISIRNQNKQQQNSAFSHQPFKRSFSVHSVSVGNLQKSIRLDLQKSLSKKGINKNFNLLVPERTSFNNMVKMNNQENADISKSLVYWENLQTAQLSQFSSVQNNSGNKQCCQKQKCQRNSYKKFVPFLNERHLGKLLSKQKQKQMKEQQLRTGKGVQSSIILKQLPTITKSDFYKDQQESSSKIGQISQERRNFQLRKQNRNRSVENLYKENGKILEKRESINSVGQKMGLSTQLANKMNFKNFSKLYHSKKRQIDGIYSSLTRRSDQEDLIGKQENDRRWKVTYVTNGKEINLPYGENMSELKHKIEQERLRSSMLMQKMRQSKDNKRAAQSSLKPQQPLSKLDQFVFKKINENLPPQECSNNPELEILFNRYVEVCQFSENLRRAELVGKRFL